MSPIALPPGSLLAATADVATLPGVAVLRGFASAAECAALAHAARCVSAPGYRPGVLAAPLPLLARVAPGLLPPLLAARDRVREAAEALGVGGAGVPLFVEFTGLLTWLGARRGRDDHLGASLGWHDDAGAPHLAQRHVSCVLYLSSAGTDFGGGDFLCEPPGGGPARSFAPEAGTLLVYASTVRHAVAAVTWGERCTLAMWLTRDGAHDEDAALLAPGRSPFTTPEALLASGNGEPLVHAHAPPDAFFCDAADGGADARLRHLATRGLRPVSPALATAGGLHLERIADGSFLPVRFQDATHALRAAAFAEWARGAALAALGDAEVTEAAAEADEYELKGRCVVAALLPRWRAANALFGPE